MPKTINPIRKALVKQSLLKGKSIREALKNAGYARGQQKGHNNATSNKVVKSCQEEILRDIEKETTVKSVLADLEEIKTESFKNKDYSTATRCTELKGKWLSMFTDRVESVPTETDDNQFSLARIFRLKVDNPVNNSVNNSQ